MLEVIIVAPLLVGCGPSVSLTPAPPAATPTLETGWILYEKPIDEFAIALPPNWKQVNLDAAALEASFDALKEHNPYVADVLDQAQELAASNGKFLALDLETDASAGYVTNITILKRPLKYALSVDELVLESLKQVESLTSVVSQPKFRNVNLAAGKSAELQYTIAVVLPDAQAKTLTMFTYLLPKEKDSYEISFGVVASQASKYAPTFERIAQSFRWIK